MTTDSWIVIGVVTSVNPARRVIRVDGVAAHAHELVNPAKVRLRLAGGTLRVCRVAAVKEAEQGTLVTLAAGTTRDTVAQMRGAEVVLRDDELTPPPEGGYDLEALIGMDVAGADGVIGTVTDAFATPAHGIVELQTGDGRTLLLPFIDEVVHEVDVAARRMTVGDIAPFAAEQDNTPPPAETADED